MPLQQQIAYKPLSRGQISDPTIRVSAVSLNPHEAELLYFVPLLVLQMFLVFSPIRQNSAVLKLWFIYKGSVKRNPHAKNLPIGWEAPTLKLAKNLANVAKKAPYLKLTKEAG